MTTEADSALTSTVAARVPRDTADRLRWLAYRQRTTVSEIVGKYIDEGIRGEDFTAYSPPD